MCQSAVPIGPGKCFAPVAAKRDTCDTPGSTTPPNTLWSVYMRIRAWLITHSQRMPTCGTTCTSPHRAWYSLRQPKDDGPPLDQGKSLCCRWCPALTSLACSSLALRSAASRCHRWRCASRRATSDFSFVATWSAAMSRATCAFFSCQSRFSFKWSEPEARNPAMSHASSERSTAELLPNGTPAATGTAAANMSPWAAGRGGSDPHVTAPE
mmetsp:Transcript_100560/g.262139  ORF Transcript_100560/g.262139 Transcript_100560/m.262139 type:complete len:211 (+) Transcript_100560:278-910(+)